MKIEWTCSEITEDCTRRRNRRIKVITDGNAGPRDAAQEAAKQFLEHFTPAQLRTHIGYVSGAVYYIEVEGEEELYYMVTVELKLDFHAKPYKKPKAKK
jgi:hypothetical protein